MNFEDERYVKLFTRDTVTWKLIEWQGRCLLPLLLRKVDRAGCIDLEGAGSDGLAALVDVPLEVVGPGLKNLLARGVVEINDDVLVFPKYLAAQEAKQTDKQRQTESRGRRRAAVVRAKIIGDDTNCDQVSHGVTKRHDLSRDVTPRIEQTRSEQTKTEPSACAHEAIPKPEVELASLGGLWRKLTDLAPILKPPREFATPTGLAPNEEGPLARQYAQAIAAGFTKADVLALAEWIQAGGIAFRSSQREYICKSFTTALQDAQKWREGGRQPIGKAPRASPQCGPAIPTGPPMSEAQKLIREANRRRKAEKETERTTDDVTDPAP